ncbi:MAG: hypothetical protein WD557_00645 [Dehalococcoidia bacterium]
MLRNDDAEDASAVEMKALSAAVDATCARLDKWSAGYTEWLFVRKAEAYFGTWLTRTKVVSLDDLGVYDARDRGLITLDEVRQLTNLDILVRGRDSTAPDEPDTVLAVEVSSTVDYEDVDRARDRAALLVRVGLRTRPAVAGHEISDGAQRFADEHGVLVKIVPASELPR